MTQPNIKPEMLVDSEGKLTLFSKLNILFIIAQNGFKDFDFVEPVLAQLFNTDVVTINKTLEEMEKQGIRLNRKWRNPSEILGVKNGTE